MIDIRGQSRVHHDEIDARVDVLVFPVVGPALTVGIVEFDCFQMRITIGTPPHCGDCLTAPGVVEVAVDEQLGIGPGRQDVIDVFAQQQTFIAAHQALISLPDGAFGFEMYSQKADFALGQLDGGIKNATADTKGNALNGVIELPGNMSLDNRMTGKDGQGACMIRTLDAVAVGQVNAGIGKPVLQVPEIRVLANFANTENVRSG